MQKIALFFGKTGKIAAAMGAPLPNPCWPPAAGAILPDPRVVTSITCYSYFKEFVCSANAIAVKKEQKQLRNSNYSKLVRRAPYPVKN